MNSKLHRQPVEGGRNGRDVLPLIHSGQKTSCRILDQLDTYKGRLTDSIIKYVTVIQPRHDEGVDYCLKVVQEVASPLPAAQGRKSWTQQLR